MSGRAAVKTTSGPHAALRRFRSDARRRPPTHLPAHQHAAHQHDSVGQRRRRQAGSRWQPFPGGDRLHRPLSAGSRRDVHDHPGFFVAGPVQHHRAEGRRARARQLCDRDEVRAPRGRCVRDWIPRRSRAKGVSPEAHRGRAISVRGALRSPEEPSGEWPTGHPDGRTGDRTRRQRALAFAPAAVALGGRGRSVVVAARRVPDRRGAGLEPLVLPDRSATRRRVGGGRRFGRPSTQSPGARGSHPGHPSGARLADARDAGLLPPEPAPGDSHRREQVPDRGGRRPCTWISRSSRACSSTT